MLPQSVGDYRAIIDLCVSVSFFGACCLRIGYNTVWNKSRVSDNNTNVFKTGLINSGNVETLDVIFDRTLAELEVVVVKFSEQV